MTSLTNVVRRKTRHSYSILYATESRPIVVSLELGDVITFRELGRRHSWQVAIDQVFRRAVLDAALALRHEKKRAQRKA